MADNAVSLIDPRFSNRGIAYAVQSSKIFTLPLSNPSISLTDLLDIFK